MWGPGNDQQNTDFDIDGSSGGPWRSDPPSDPPTEHPLSQPPLSAVPYHLRNLIAAIVANVGVVVGSLGPWAHLLTVSSINGLGVSGWTLVGLLLGAVSGIALCAQLNWGRTTFSLRWAVPIAWAAVVAGVGCLAIAVVYIVGIMSFSNEFFGTSAGTQVGWGLWMVLISCVVLCVTAAIVAVQIGKANEDHTRRRWPRHDRGAGRYKGQRPVKRRCALASHVARATVGSAR